MGSGTALAIALKRSTTVLRPDPSRVLLRQFEPGNAQRMSGIMQRIMAVPEAQVATLLQHGSADFSQRHLNLPQRFLDRFADLAELLPEDAAITGQRRLLIGSYFLSESSLESAALFNPSMLPY